MKNFRLPVKLVGWIMILFTVFVGHALCCDKPPSTDGGKSTVQADQAAVQKYYGAMQIHYLEIVSKNVNAVCAAYAAAHGVQFGEPVAVLGNARTAALPGGGLVGVRAPMRDDEEPVVRPYWLVDDIEAAVAAVVAAGGQIAHPPWEIPGHGKFAIYFQGDNQHGLWQR